MKKIAIVLVLVTALSFTLKAQQKSIPIDFKASIGKTATLCDTVYSFKIVNDTLTLVNMGGNYPNQKFTIAIRGNKVTLDWVHLKRKHLCVTGVLAFYKEMPEIVAFEPNQITVN